MASKRLQEMAKGPVNWKKLEMKQMKAIHRAYRDAMTGEDNIRQHSNILTRASFESSQTDRQMPVTTNDALHTENPLAGLEETVNGNAQFVANITSVDNGITPAQEAGLVRNDREWYLPRDSCLRSVGGEMLRPRNPPFKDYVAFKSSCDFEDWKPYYQENVGDRYLVETAESICAHVCTAQSRGELRVKQGGTVGRLFRQKREHITPLALVLHEIKRWATHQLRTASIFDKETYMDIDQRIQYLHRLEKKEVWGAATLPLQSGMRPIAHDKLFRLLLSAREDLTRARDYAYRGYCRRSSREKLSRLINLIKNVMMNGMKITSCLMSVHENLNNAKARKLQPTDLLNSSHNQSFVDYRNVANVCLRSLCEVPLYRMALLGDFPNGYYLPELENWRDQNIFCKPTKKGSEAQVIVMEDDIKGQGIPWVYKSMSLRLQEDIKSTDKNGKFPPNRKQLTKSFIKAYGSEEKMVEILRKLSMCLAALQDVVPSCFAIQAFWDIAGEGGNFTVYDTLRAQIIQVMSNTIERVFIIQTSLLALFDCIGKIVDKHKTEMEKRRLRTRKSEYEPPWLSNHQLVAVEFLPKATKCYNDTLQQLTEIMKDAWDYSLSEEELNEKVEACKKTALSLVGGNPKRVVNVPDSNRGEFSATKFVDIESADWLNVTGTNKIVTISDPWEQVGESTKSDLVLSSTQLSSKKTGAVVPFTQPTPKVIKEEFTNPFAEDINEQVEIQ